MTKFQGVFAGAVAIAAVVGMAGPAMAYDGSAEVSCDVDYTTNLVTLFGGGTSSAKQVYTSERNNRYYWAVSNQGNTLQKKSAVDGATVTWTAVTDGNYTWKTVIVSNQNCNGAWPGQGNSSLSYTITP